MDCPACGRHGAYMGLTWIHCQNMECRYYDARYTEQERERRQRMPPAAKLKLLRELMEINEADRAHQAED